MTEDQTKTSETEESEETKTEDTEQRADDVEAIKAALKKANKEAEKSRKELQDLRDKDKSETEKERDARAAAEKRADKAERDALRVKVGTKKKLPVEIAERLTGDTEEEMEADADRLAAILKPGSPQGDADQGARGSAGNGKTNMNDFMFGRK